jgi:alpha-D-xyloside xylohydrolase
MKRALLFFCVVGFGFTTTTTYAQLQTTAGIQYLQCMPKDQSGDFSDLSNTYFLADSLASFDAAKGEGQVNWKRYRLSPRQAFNLNGYWPVRTQMLDFPDTQYDNDPNLSFKIDFVSPRCVRIRMATSPIEAPRKDEESLMLAGPVPTMNRTTPAASSSPRLIRQMIMPADELFFFSFSIVQMYII